MSLNGKERAGEHNFLLHIFTSLKRKQRFFKYMFTIHTLFLRLRFRLVRQEILLRVGFQIRSSLWTKERGPLRQAQGPGFTCGTVSEFVELAVKLKSFNFPLGAKSKGSNGVVAVGLPHRNYSVFNKPLSINRK